MLNRQPRTRYDLLKPSGLKQQVKSFEENLGNRPIYNVGEAVYVLNFGSHGSKWVPAVIISVLSAMNYRVQVDETIWKRHRNQIRPRSMPASMLPDLQTDTPRLNQPWLPTVFTPASTSAFSVALSATVTADKEKPLTVVPATPELAPCAPANNGMPVPTSGQDRPRRITQKPQRYRD